MKGKSSCYKSGGVPKMPKMMDREDKDREEEAEAEGKKFAAGGRIKKMHKAHGKKSKMRVDKKARGGKLATPKSPLSGAEPVGLPGGGKGENYPDKSND